MSAYSGIEIASNLCLLNLIFAKDQVALGYSH